MQRASSKIMEKMEAKKAPTDVNPKAFPKKKAVEFMGEVKQELKRVEWTSKEELKTYTLIVFLSTFLFGMFIYFMDLIIQGVLGGVNLIVRAIFG